MAPKVAILLCNLGTPTEPTPKGVRQFLRPFLSDKRVIEVPAWIWQIILNAIIIPFRAKPVAHGYQSIWQAYGDSPLRAITQAQVDGLQMRLSDRALVDYAFTYGKPSIAQQLERYRCQVDTVVLLPLYPQYSATTTAAIFDQVSRYQLQQRDVVDVYIFKQYYHTQAYQEALAHSVRDFWRVHGQSEYLLTSFHGIPQAYGDKGDPYPKQCHATANALAEQLHLSGDKTGISFQSRLGRAKWLTPYTVEYVQELASQGIKTVDVVCPSFSADCLETLEEISEEIHEAFCSAGGERLRLIPCLNASDAHIDMMATLVDSWAI